MKKIIINGVAIATPSKFEFTKYDLDDESERTADGRLNRNRIAVKDKIQLEWKYLSDEDISKLFNAVNDVFFTCSFPSPATGEMVTKEMYVGDRTAPAYNFALGLWESLKMNFIER